MNASTNEHVGKTQAKLRTSPAISDFAVYASSSVALKDRAKVHGGDVGVQLASEPLDVATPAPGSTAFTVANGETRSMSSGSYGAVNVQGTLT